MSWVAVGVAAAGLVSSNVQSNRAKGASREAARLQSEGAVGQAHQAGDRASTRAGVV